MSAADWARDVLRLVALLARHPKTHITDAAKQLGVPPRKVLELVRVATLCGKQPFGPADLIEIHLDGKKRMDLEMDQNLGQPIRLTVKEALALAVALHGLLRAGEGAYSETARAALDKLRGKLTEDVEEQVAALEHRIVLGSEDGDLEQRLGRLHRGLETRREVEIEYFTASRNEMTKRRFRPYLLVQHLGSWYAVGRDLLRREERVFKVERIKGVELTETPYQIPASFRPQRYTKGRMFVGKPKTGRVRFSSHRARYVREEWDPSRVEEADDGAVVGQFEFTHPEGAALSILGYGPSAEVLEPPELRGAWRSQCKMTLALYRDD